MTTAASGTVPEQARQTAACRTSRRPRGPARRGTGWGGRRRKEELGVPRPATTSRAGAAGAAPRWLDRNARLTVEHDIPGAPDETLSLHFSRAVLREGRVHPVGSQPAQGGCAVCRQQALRFDSSVFVGYPPVDFRMSLRLQLDGEAWAVMIEELSKALPKDGPPVRLCLIGSAACLLGGMEGRTSADLGIWKPASDYDRMELKAAAEQAGLLFDPKQTLDPQRPYLQLVEPGLTQLGSFEPVFVERLGRLHLYRPPIENLIAAKLIRAEAKDLGDIRFLVSRYRPDLPRVRQIIAQFDVRARKCATENLVYLDVLET